MIIDEKSKIELFEEFYSWLKEDGLKPKKSERLHRKKIFSGLMGNNKMTLENFNDFTKDKMNKRIMNLKDKEIIFENMNIVINYVEILNDEKKFVLSGRELKINPKKIKITCDFNKISEIEKLMKEMLCTVD